MRLFIGVSIPGFALKEIIKIQEMLRPGLGSSIRWTNPTSLHLTLKFIGETTEHKRADIVKVIQDASKGFSGFSIDCIGLGVFPNRRLPKVIWLGFELKQELLKLQNEIDNNLVIVGFGKEKQGFSPHLTIGRVNSQLASGESMFLNEKMDEFSGKVITTFPITEINLIKSDLKQSGPLYTIQNTIPLKPFD